MVEDAEDGSPGAGLRLRCIRVADAFVVERDDVPVAGLVAFAASLAPDPEHVVVVVGTDAVYPLQAWAPVIPVLAESSRSIRLVTSGPEVTSMVGAGQWLARQLGQPVLAQDGAVVRGSGGSLFVPAGQGTGWLRLDPGREPAAGSRRFPCPAWSCAVLERTSELSDAVVAEPLPGGAWIRPAAAVGTERHRHRRRLISGLARREDRVYVVLGYPGAPPVPADDVERFWRLLAPATRAAVTFVAYGPVAVGGGQPVGQALADRFGEPVMACTGMPLSRQAAGGRVRVRALGADGSAGWEPFASELGYYPAGRGGDGPLPVVLRHRAPVSGLAQVSRGVYAYGQGTVIEVVQSGLWLRRGGEPPRASLARTHPVLAGEAVVFIDAQAADPDRLAEVTDELLNALGPAIRVTCRLLPLVRPPVPAGPAASLPPAAHPVAVARPLLPPAAAGQPRLPAALAGPPGIRLESGPPARAAMPAPAAALALDSGAPAAAEAPGPAAAQAAPAVQAPGPRVQPVPEPGGSVIPPSQGLAQERTWLRRAMSSQHDGAASLVERVLAENPGIRGNGSTPAADLLTDLAALRIYLSGHAQALDAAVRAGKAGPHVPFARCVAAGLRRLPSYRGAARLRVALADAGLQWYQDRRVVTEWGFCAAVTSGRLRLPGTAEFWIWSMTARRTGLLEPRVPGQVLFLPGTSFKVLQVSGGGRREVLLRELSASEIGPDGQVEPGRVPLDEVALAGLGEAATAFRAEEPGEDLPEGYEDRFGNPPGLIVGLDAGTAGLAGKQGESAR